MTLGAVVERLVLSTPNVDAAAAFYRDGFGYEVLAVGEERHCAAPQRSLWLRPGPANQLAEAHYRFPSQEAFESFVDRLRGRDLPFEHDKVAHIVCVCDPDGRRLRFRFGGAGGVGAALPTGRLQHYAVRSPDPVALAAFYVDQLGFTVSDEVRDDAGQLGAIFLRTDPEHHALAIFRAPDARFDHFSCETDDWNSLRDWADRLSEARIPLCWGIGRHGPGNDLFFMVKDPDGNMAEISADLEVCSEDRPVGKWRHEARTLNLWGMAIMRS